MKANELAKKVKAAKGKIEVPVLFAHDVIYIFVEKQDLIAHFEKMGTDETGMVLENKGEHFALERDYDIQ